MFKHRRRYYLAKLKLLKLTMMLLKMTKLVLYSIALRLIRNSMVSTLFDKLQKVINLSAVEPQSSK